MGADWDPMEMDDAPSSGYASAAKKPEASKPKGPVMVPMASADCDKIAEGIFQNFTKKTPWCVFAKMKSDVDWQPMTCTMTDWPHVDVKFEVGEYIRYVILNRPNENNSMQDTLGAGMSDAFLRLALDYDARLAVVTGEGRMFCAGGDPKAWQAAAAAGKSGGQMLGDGTVGTRVPMKWAGQNLQEHMEQISARAVASKAFVEGQVEFSRITAAKQWLTLALLPQVTCCLLNGSGMGGGVGVTCMCDYVIGVKKAYMVVSEVKIGVIPATISPYVVAKIGAANAKRMFNTAENMKAERAKEVGIYNEVVENMAEGHLRVKELIKLIQPTSGQAAQMIKECVFGAAGQPITEPVMFFCAALAARNLKSRDAKAGREAETKGEKKPWENEIIKPLY